MSGAKEGRSKNGGIKYNHTCVSYLMQLLVGFASSVLFKIAV